MSSNPPSNTPAEEPVVPEESLAPEAPATTGTVTTATGSVLVTLPRGRYNDLKASLKLPGRLVAPYQKGQPVGTLSVSLDGKTLLERPLVALADAPEAGFFGRLSDGIWLWFKGDQKVEISSTPNTQ